MVCANHKDVETMAKLLAKLKAKGLRITEQRKSLLEFLVETDKALTIGQIYHGLSERHVQMDEASVYRSMKMLMDLNIVHELGHGQLSLCQHSTCGHEHIHLSWLCDACGDAVEPHMKEEDLEDLQKILRVQSNQIFHIHINYLCEKCRQAG